MSKDEYLITDTPLKALTVFAMPMILGSFFQQIYNIADSIIVYLLKKTSKNHWHCKNRQRFEEIARAHV